jgi:hypothetical protein
MSSFFSISPGDDPVSLKDKKRQHEAFWRGEGSSLILIPAPDRPDEAEGEAQGDAWGTPSASPGSATYPECFAEPQLMWESEIHRARAVRDWPTDGIPTVRPNLGVVFINAIAGQDYLVPDGQMPWPGEPLTENAIRAVPEIDIDEAELMRRAAEFYAIHVASGEDDIAAYHPDTQGVFDTAHMLYGNSIFCDVIDPSRREWINELLEVCLGLYLTVSRRLKALIGEDTGWMIHGHGTAQGVYFPHVGVRVSEDTATLFSPETVAEVIMPHVEWAAEPFGGGFAHFCGRHESLFEQLCASPLICAIDNQPGMHDTRWMLERCAETGTVLCSRVDAEPGEGWEAYTRRMAGLVRETGARCILRPMVYPTGRDECAAMRDLWHELTG